MSEPNADEELGRGDFLYPRRAEDGSLVGTEQVVGSEEHLLRNYRFVFLTGPIVDIVLSNVLFALDSLSHKPIKLVITSIGGSVDIALLLYDTIRLMHSPVYTLGRYCASAAAMLLAAGKKRYLVPHAKVMLHLPSGQAVGDARDWEIQHKEMQKYKNKIVDVFLECGVKKSREEVLADMDRDFWLEPQEAIDYGLADKMMTSKTLAEWML